MSLKENDSWLEGRHEWLAERGATEADIRISSIGEYVVIKNADGTETEVLLPEQYQQH